jgi:glycine cleavage system T protein (aminomethyltransferase)
MERDMTLRFTPFHPRTAPLMLGQAWRRWAGYAVASSYEFLHDREYAAIRNAAALIDVTPLYKYLITGPGAERLLDRVLTRDVTRCKVHQVMYMPWCDSAGKVIDDGTLSRLGAETFRLTSAEPNLRWLHKNSRGLEVRVEDISESTAALSIQGPNARAILVQVADGDIAGLRYFRMLPTTIRGIPVTVSRTGYTGDLGFEIWVDSAHAVELWDVLTEAGAAYGLCPAGIWALDLARIEAGLIMLDVDYVSSHKAAIEGQKSSPYELNLGWAVNLDKAPFVGQRALRAEKARGPAWSFVGVEVEWDSLERLYSALGLPPQLPSVAWRSSVPLHDGDRQVGYATSGCWSPLLKRLIALAHVESAYVTPGTPLAIEVTVEHRRKKTPARVAALPFLELERKKA